MTDRKKIVLNLRMVYIIFRRKQTKTKQPRPDCCQLQMFVPKPSCFSKAKHNVQEDLIFTSLISFSLNMKKFFCQFKQIKQNAIWRIGISCQISLLTLDLAGIKQIWCYFLLSAAEWFKTERQKDRRTMQKVLCLHTIISLVVMSAGMQCQWKWIHIMKVWLYLQHWTFLMSFVLVYNSTYYPGCLIPDTNLIVTVGIK